MGTATRPGSNVTIDEATAPAHLKRRKPRLIEPPPPEHLQAVVEAILFVADAPLEVAALARAIAAPKGEVEKALDALGDQCRERGVRLQRTGDLVQLVSAPHTAAYVERFLGLEHPPLTNASIETLAIIAYRQPITRAGIESVRGVDCDGPIRTLMARGLIEEIGRAPVVGRPVLFGTTVRFLEYFGLERPDDLPPLPLLDEEQPAQDEEEAAI
jgi:segregation and condensation protein B